MAERPWHDRWLKDPWLEKDRESDFSRRNNIRPGDPLEVREAKTRSKPNTVTQVMGIGLGFGAALAWYSRLVAKGEAERTERSEFRRKQNELWRNHEEKATARGAGAFDNVRKTADGFWEESSQKRAPGVSSAPPLDRTQMNPWQQARFDAAQDIRYTLESEAQWKADPKGMAENARYRAEALGEPLDPRAKRYFAERGLPAPGGPASGGAVATRPSVSAGQSVNPNAIEVGPGVDLEGMKRAKPGPNQVGGRAGAWAGRAGAAAGWLAVGFELWDFGRDWKELGLKGAWKKRHPDDYKRGDMFRGNPAVDAVVDEFIRQNTRKPSSKPALVDGAGLTEEQIRANYSENPPDERAPSNVGGVPIDYVPPRNDTPWPYGTPRGWGDDSSRPKRGRPFKDPHGIGQARLQAEHDMDEQREADRRKQREEEQKERKASNYIKYIETQDRKQERAREASAKRFDADERSFWWNLQLEEWERERLEGGRGRRHRSITVNSWQAAGATVGGFAHINVELVRSEIERSLERGDTAIRMN